MTTSAAYTTVSVSDLGKALAYFHDIIGMEVRDEATSSAHVVRRVPPAFAVRRPARLNRSGGGRG
jgi:catechol-2,3-dioxygenase